MHTTLTKPAPASGWRTEQGSASLPEVHASVAVPKGGSRWRKMMAYVGPGLMVAVGYMDPGNWATDLAGGAQFGYMLLSVILISNFMAMLLQHLSLKLGIATGRDLAQASRDAYPRPVALALWVMAEVAIAACDLAEVIGSAIALNLLFGLPLILGVLITAVDVVAVLFLQNRGFRYIEALVGGLIMVIALCFGYEVIVSNPQVAPMLAGLLPSPQIVFDPSALYIAIGILGATVMPHNLYLHSSIVQTRAYPRTDRGRASAIRYATVDSTVSLMLAFFINASILILSAAAFYGTQYAYVADIGDAYQLLTPVLGAGMASTLFAVALLASGQNSTLTGTLAGQIIMEGFLHLRIPGWMRRLVTRLIAIIPAVIVTAIYGARGTGALLVLSQVILSLQLSFAVVPLVMFTGDKAKMGRFVNPPWLSASAWAVTAIIVGLNGYLLAQTVIGWM
ncbi:MAG: Nramp family divalent metal transporter [Chloroflexales bacterium]